MDSELRTLKQLIIDSKNEMHRLKYSRRSISTCQNAWKEFEDYSFQNGSLLFSQELAIRFLKEKYNYPDSTAMRHTTSTNAVASAIRRLGDISLHGRFLGRFKKQEEPLPDGFKQSLDAYIDYCLKRNNKISTIKRNKLVLRGFLEFLSNAGVMNTFEINPRNISDYSASLLGYSKKSAQRELGCLKGFFRAAYFNGFHEKDLSEWVPQLRFAKQDKIATVWSKDDISKILAAVDRGNPHGKRDYAILLLVTQLGLRDSDVRNLKLENIKWETCTIEFTQVKTEQTNTLPLLPDLGWAIIDYLKSGRPTTDATYVFVTHKAPYGQIQKVGNIVARYQREAGIKIDSDRQHGIHSLRHTLASRLLEQYVPLELISGILGHINVNSAKVYLHTDIDGLRKCALDLDKGCSYE